MNFARSEARQPRSRASPPPPGPFGYSFLPPHDTPHDAGPAPPPGPSLLDDSESNMLDSFFTTLNGSQFDVGDSWFQDITHDNGGGAFSCDWAEGLPPNLEGSTTSLSQPPILSLNSAKSSGSLMGGLGPDSDILAAASMLYGQGGNAINFPTQHLFPDGAVSGMSPPHLGPQRIKQEQTHRSLGNRGHGSRHLSLQPQHTSVFNPEEPSISAEPQKAGAVQTLRWGSDAGFVDHGYRRPDNIADIEETTQTLLESMKCLEPQTSTTNTRAPTPVGVFGFSRNNSNGAGAPRASEEANRGDGDNDSLAPRKRPKMEKEEDEEDYDDSSTPPRLKRPKSSSGSRLKRGSSESASKKPKTQQSNKTARENLSEEQKRTNHILSEQKRRNLIKQGFDELCSLVPDLRGGGFSKSAMLLQAADYLDEVLKGNNALRQQLSQLKAVNGYVMPR
ncbi:hypothetical protein UA08_02982 [Talaromyces atroroseus]|uniref:BHLH domain-containing protein n=1 Tax=Talaromyces atroroseus TaxID=1441469 RepID=A0A225AQA9_TALAT|nr:hypothetical protein UA08_02982 [Talaromyces atroroseus]OKL61683.1 hypothetical protein UA08_02982 [Talaromyces atroroseus]